MKVRNSVLAALSAVICFCFASVLSAQVFYTENFDYADGDLTTVSEGLWQAHSDGGSVPVQVVDGNAVVVAGTPNSEDVNRQTGVIMGNADVWYYAVVFSVDEVAKGTPVNNDYFIHFKDAGFGFNARLATVASDGANDYGLQIWPSSFGDGRADWDGDFAFGEVLICVVEFDNGTGTARLWVNPDNIDSTNISQVNEMPDGDPCDCMRATEAVALRQDNTNGSIVTVQTISVGDDFDAVLAAVGGSKGCDNPLGDVNLDGFVNLEDVDPFVIAISQGSTQCEADINQDGSVTLEDVDPFVALLAGGG